MIARLTAPAALVSTLVIGVACGSSGEGGREVPITQSQAGCSPKTVEATAGEKLNLVVKNESGTELEEVVVPEGKTREVGFDVPDEPGTYEIKCYVPGDIETTIEITVKAA